MIEDTKAKIAVMQAFVDGKQIEYYHSATRDGWQSVTYPTWRWHNTNYRVAEDMELKAYKVFTASLPPGVLCPLVLTPAKRNGLREIINAVKAGEIT